MDFSDCGCIDTTQLSGIPKGPCPNLAGFGYVWLNTPSSQGVYHVAADRNGHPLEKTYSNVFLVCKN